MNARGASDLDLNKIGINTDTKALFEQRDFGCESGHTKVHFKNLDLRLKDYIQKADAVVGCVAWLTNARILWALSKTKGVQIVVQKEDWLRPDLGDKGRVNTTKARALFAQLPKLTRYDFSPGLLSGMSICGDTEMDAVRCVGALTGKRKFAAPRAHHKFVVFCKMITIGGDLEEEIRLEPYAVWTGSFNFTKNATHSFENALYIEDKIIALAYFNEYQQVAALSEPCEWTSEWVDPEWRIGT